MSPYSGREVLAAMIEARQNIEERLADPRADLTDDEREIWRAEYHRIGEEAAKLGASLIAKAAAIAVVG